MTAAAPRSRWIGPFKIQLLLGFGTWALLAMPEALGAPTTLLWSGLIGLPIIELLFCVLWLPTVLASWTLDRMPDRPRVVATVTAVSVSWGVFGAAALGGPNYLTPFVLFAVEGLVYSAAFLWLRGRIRPRPRDVPGP
jgi:hypothetical protein